MCGIVGSINLELDPGALRYIAHRGPDDQGWEQFTVGHHRVCLGHTRLAIQDISSSGHQPMLGLRGAISYNGEIYNHLDLRPSVAVEGFHGHSDTETLLRLLENLGPDCLASLNGIFAFAYLDRHGQALYLVRDAFGVKPLYYSIRENTLLFSSELKLLRDMGGDAVDLQNLALALRYRSSYAPRTIYRGIEKLIPGHYLKVDLGQPRLAISTYRYTIDPPTHSSLDRGSAVDAYRTRFGNAVRSQLLSDVEVGLLLSGGVDSALVGSAMSRALPYRPKAFTVGFGDAAISEIEDARVTARQLGLDHYELCLDSDEFLETLRTCARIVEEPTATTSIVPMYALARLASRHVRVVLSGQGADECNGGYARYRAEQLVNPVTSSLAAGALACHLVDPDSRAGRLLGYLSETDGSARYLKSHEIFSDSRTRQLLGLASAVPAPALPLAAVQDRANRMMSLDLALNLPDDLLLYTDKLTMHFALECRVPFLDSAVVELLMSLPSGYKVDVFGGKRLHRKLAQLELSREIVNRRKKGFLVPTARWFRQSRKHWDILLGGAGLFSTTFDPAGVEDILRSHERGINLEKQIMMLLTCEALLNSSAQECE